ncbi:MAG: ATP-dependent Clp protease proteolytic subunit [Planctomycetes bacterium]|nr:ATP-dependent Clp protease proteolytic subunit [Planctomycetota bacterium]
MTPEKKRKKPLEIALIGEVDDWEHDVVKEILEAKPRRECTLYIDSGGGSVYGALAVATLMRRRELASTGIVLGECSSASLLVFAACQKRFVSRYSTLLFHRMRWQSDKRIGAREAGQWSKHFEGMENEIDELQERWFGSASKEVREWTERGEYVSGAQVVQAGLAELFEV